MATKVIEPSIGISNGNLQWCPRRPTPSVSVAAVFLVQTWVMDRAARQQIGLLPGEVTAIGLAIAPPDVRDDRGFLGLSLQLAHPSLSVLESGAPLPHRR